jgi:ABC-type multidrug transport system permease subunit
VLQVLVELPYVALQALLYSGITYLLVGFELAAAKFFWYLLFTFLTLMFFTYYGEWAVFCTAGAVVQAVRQVAKLLR